MLLMEIAACVLAAAHEPCERPCTRMPPWCGADFFRPFMPGRAANKRVVLLAQYDAVLMRVILFTDTLADVNGVSRFIRDVAGVALRTGKDLRVVTSTALPFPDGANLINLAPRCSVALPGYRELRISAPPLRRIARILDDLRPDAVHISTPGPVGLAALVLARRRGIPLLGTYHTDFPAYTDRLFADEALSFLMECAMRRIYTPFDRIFTRSADYARRLKDLGIHCGKLRKLRPGTDTDRFHPRFARRAIWSSAELGIVVGTGVKVIYAGRVSVEKNLPMLERVWTRVAATGLDADLVVLGDGPYRAAMQAALSGRRAYFPGFRHGLELSELYASGDLMVFPSATDTLGQTVMEAQASGLPVLVSDQGGPREVVRDGRTGLVISASDDRAWSAAITRLVADANLRRTMGSAARAFMESHSIEESFNDFWRAHEQTVNERRTGSSAVGNCSR